MRDRLKMDLHNRRTAVVAIAVALSALYLSLCATRLRAEQVVSTSEVFHTEGSNLRPPKSWDGLLVTPRDVGPDGYLRIRFWRIGPQRANRGSVALDLEIRRDTDGDGTFDSVEVLTDGGRVIDHAYSTTLGPLAPMRAGDMVLVSARLKAMPKFGSQGRATLDVALLDSLSTCSEPTGVGGEITPPRKVIFPSPQYTEEARLARVQGVAIIQTTIDCDGRIARIRVLESLPLGLERASVEALSRWRFAPARVDGVPVAVLFNLTVNFQLQSVGASSIEELAPSVTVRGRMTDPPLERR